MVLKLLRGRSLFWAVSAELGLFIYYCTGREFDFHSFPSPLKWHSFSPKIGLEVQHLSVTLLSGNEHGKDSTLGKKIIASEIQENNIQRKQFRNSCSYHFYRCSLKWMQIPSLVLVRVGKDSERELSSLK